MRRDSGGGEVSGMMKTKVLRACSITDEEIFNNVHNRPGTKTAINRAIENASTTSSAITAIVDSVSCPVVKML